MTRTVPLRLRSVQVTARVAVEPCGPGCLLEPADAFSAAIPGGMALLQEPGGGVLRGVLFETQQGTLIKAKAVPKPTFGRDQRFSDAGHARALEILREGGFPGICRPERECRCSLEFRRVEGRIAWAAFSMHAARLAEMFPVRALGNAAEAAGFVQAAWSVLSALNRLGISHGDPSFYNFVVDGSPILIDLDQCVYTGASESAWDQNVFLYSTIVPVMGGFMTAEEVAVFVDTVMAGAVLLCGGGAGVLVPAIAQAMEYNSCTRQLRSLAMHQRALSIQVTETATKLARSMEEERVRHRDMLAVAEERLAALQAAHREMERLQSAAAERLDAMLEKEQVIAILNAEVGQLRARIEQAGAALADQQQHAAALEASAAGHLDTMRRQEQRIASLEAAIAGRDAELGELEARLQQAAAEGERLQREADALAGRIRVFEQETWREYLSRRRERHRRQAPEQP